MANMTQYGILDFSKSFKLRKNETKQIIILNDKLDEEFKVFAHRVASDNQGVQRVCLANSEYGDPSKCPACASGIKSNEKKLFSVSDVAGYTKRTGQQVQYVKCLIEAPYQLLDVLIDVITKHGTLRGASITANRSEERFAPAVGDSFTFNGFMELPEDPAYTPFTMEEIGGMLLTVTAGVPCSPAPRYQDRNAQANAQAPVAPQPAPAPVAPAPQPAPVVSEPAPAVQQATPAQTTDDDDDEDFF